MADDKNQKPMTTLGISMRRFGRSLMRHYERPLSEPQQIDRQAKPYQAMSTSPLNWDNIVTPKQNNREAPLADEAIQEDNPEQFAPPLQARRQAHPPQQPIQRQPAPQKKKGLDPRLQAILNFHNQRDAEREIQRKERRTKWEEAQEQGDTQQSAPDIPGWKPKPRASFDYIETSALIKDKAEKPEAKQEKIQRETDEKLPSSSRSKVTEEQEFSQPEVDDGYIAANEPSWDDFDDDFDEVQEIEPYNDFQETERITPLDDPFADIETSQNINMPSPKQGDTADDNSPKPLSLQRQADDFDEDLSDDTAIDSAPPQYTDARDEDSGQSFELPATQSPDAPQGYFERRKPNPQRPTHNQQEGRVQRKPQAKSNPSPRQNDTQDTESHNDTHASDEDLSESSQDFAGYDIEENTVQRQADEMWDNDEDFSQGSINTPVDNMSDNTRPDAPYSIQRQADNDWDDDFDTQIVDTSDHLPSDTLPQPQIDNAPRDSSRPIQRQVDDNNRQENRDFGEQETYSHPVNSVDDTREQAPHIQRQTDNSWQENDTSEDDHDNYSSVDTTSDNGDSTPHPIQRQSEEDTSQYEDYTQAFDTIENPLNEGDTLRPIQRQAENNWQEDDTFPDENDYSSQVNTAENFRNSVQRQIDEDFTSSENYTLTDNTDNTPRDTSHPIQRQVDNQNLRENSNFRDKSNYTQPIDTSNNPLNDAQHPIQGQANNYYENSDLPDEDNYSQTVDAPRDNSSETSQPIQRLADADANRHDDSDFPADDTYSQSVDTSNNDTPQRHIQRRQVSKQDESPRQSQPDKPVRKVQGEADTSSRNNDANNSDFAEDIQNFPEIDNTEANSPIVQRSMGADGQMVYNLVEADDRSIARQDDPTSNLHQALIDAGIVPADSPSPETFEQSSVVFEDSAPPNQSNTHEATVQRHRDEHSINSQPSEAEPVNPTHPKSSEIVQRQMGADGEMYYNKAQEDQPLPEQSVDVFQGLMQAGMISPEDNPAFNTDVSSADNTAIQRTDNASQSDIGISQDIQNAMLQRLRDKNKDIIQQKEQARDTYDDLQHKHDPIQPSYTANVQRTPPIDMLMREEFVSDDDSVDDVEKLTRDVYRLLSNRLRDEAERRNRK